jgi:hypothetical protein
MLSGSENQPLDQGEHRDGTQVPQPAGVFTFEGFASKFNGEQASKNNKGSIICLVILTAIILVGLILGFKHPERVLEIVFVVAVFATVLIGVPLLVTEVTLVETPYGEIYCYKGVSSITYPIVDAYSGRARYKDAKFQENLGVRDAAQDFYKNQIKKNPELWLRYMFYREQVEKLENIIKGLPKPPAEEQGRLEWYTAQRDHYYDLFINAQ